MYLPKFSYMSLRTAQALLKKYIYNHYWKKLPNLLSTYGYQCSHQMKDNKEHVIL